LHKSKRYDQANTAYQRAIQLAPSDPIKMYLQGINFEVWGKPDEAREHLQKAIDLGISGNYLSLTQQAIGRLGS
jgi:tetratricopeptide (TPR) repeat protein